MSRKAKMAKRSSLAELSTIQKWEASVFGEIYSNNPEGFFLADRILHLHRRIKKEQPKSVKVFRNASAGSLEKESQEAMDDLLQMVLYCFENKCSQKLNYFAQQLMAMATRPARLSPPCDFEGTFVHSIFLREEIKRNSQTFRQIFLRYTQEHKRLSAGFAHLGYPMQPLVSEKTLRRRLVEAGIVIKPDKPGRPNRK